MTFRINDGIIMKSNLSDFLLGKLPPVWQVIAECREHKNCMLAICGVYTIHTKKNKCILIGREKDESLKSRIHRQRIRAVAKFLVNLFIDPKDIAEVSSLAFSRLSKK